MGVWRGLRQWELVVQMQVGPDTNPGSMPALQRQLRKTVPDRSPATPVWVSMLKEPQGHMLRARMVVVAGYPGVAAERGVELLQEACQAIGVHVTDVEQVHVAAPKHSVADDSAIPGA